MIVSWNWIKQLVPLTIPAEEFERRLMLAGLNHEETHPVGDDLAIDLEITSNRPDCLGHIGIAREASVVFRVPLAIPNPQPQTGKSAVGRIDESGDPVPATLHALHGSRDSRRKSEGKPAVVG